MNQMNRDVRRYLRETMRWLPCSGKMKRQIMQEISSRIRDYLMQQPDTTFTDLQAHFGTPQIIAATYIANLGTGEILENMRSRRRVVTMAVATAILVLLFWAAHLTIDTIRFEKSKVVSYTVEIEVISNFRVGGTKR